MGPIILLNTTMLELIIVGFFSFYLGAKLKGILMIMTFRKLLQDLGISQRHLRDFAQRHGIELPDEDPSEKPAAAAPEELDDATEIRIEQHQGQLFAWRTSDNTFMAQGPDREGLFRSLEQRFGSGRFVVRKDEGADLIRES